MASSAADLLLNASSGSVFDPQLTFEDSPQLLQWYTATFTHELDLVASHNVSAEAGRKFREASLVQRLAAVDQVSALLDALGVDAPRRWEPDAGVSCCPLCAAQFSLTCRRHHCRSCLRVRCGQCAPRLAGAPRTCGSCQRRGALFELVRRVRVLERGAWLAPSRSGIMAVCRAYRDAIEGFAGSEHESGVLVRGLHSFLDLAEVRHVLQQSLAAADSAPSSPRA
jgi:hypothetical protein